MKKYICNKVSEDCLKTNPNCPCNEPHTPCDYGKEVGDCTTKDTCSEIDGYCKCVPVKETK